MDSKRGFDDRYSMYGAECWMLGVECRVVSSIVPKKDVDEVADTPRAFVFLFSVLFMFLVLVDRFNDGSTLRFLIRCLCPLSVVWPSFLSFPFL